MRAIFCSAAQVWTGLLTGWNQENKANIRRITSEDPRLIQGLLAGLALVVKATTVLGLLNRRSAN